MRCSVLLLIALGAWAQGTPPRPPLDSQLTPHSRTAVVQPGTKLSVALNSTVEAGRAHVGDTFKMTLMAPVRAAGEEIVIPRGATLLGRITESVRRDKKQTESRLSFVVEHAAWKAGEVGLHAVFDARDKSQPEAADFSVPGTNAPHPYMVHAPPDGQVIDPSLGPPPSAEVPLDSFEHVEVRRAGTQTTLISQKRNIVLESGTRFTIVQVEPRAE